MDGALLKKILLRTAPPLAVVALMLYYTFYVGNNADKLYRKKDKQRHEQIQHPVTDESAVGEPNDAAKTASDGAAQAPQAHQDGRLPSFEQIFTGDFWGERSPEQWQRLFMAFADEAANGCIPIKSCGEYRSELGFSAEMRNGEWRVTRKCAGRYEKYVNLLCAIDAEGAVKLFLRQRDALDALLKEMGFAGTDCVTLAMQALAVFADMPVPDREPALLKGDGGIFVYKDTELERLPPMRKLCLRMGVANAKRLKDKANEFSSQFKTQLSGATENIK